MAPPGLYRVIAIIVTPETWDSDSPKLTEKRLDNLWRCGKHDLPKVIGDMSLPEETKATALIYEFTKKKTEESAELVLGMDEVTEKRLKKSGIIALTDG